MITLSRTNFKIDTVPKHYTVLQCTERDTVLGYVAYEKRSFPTNSIEIGCIIVNKPGFGTGKRIVKKFIKDFSSKGTRVFKLSVPLSDDESYKRLNFYYSSGFMATHVSAVKPACVRMEYRVE